MWPGKFMDTSGIKGFNILPRDSVKTSPDCAEETKDKGVTYTLKVFNKMPYKQLILYQEDMVCFHISKESKTNKLPNRDTRKVREKLSTKLKPTTGDSKTRLQKIFAKSEIKD